MIILIPEADDYSAEALGIYGALGELRVFSSLTRQELLQELQDTDILVVRLAHQIDAEVFSAAKKLKVIGTPTTGLDHIDTEEANKRGIMVLSLKGEQEFLSSIAATPEHTLALTLASLRSIPQAHMHTQEGGWDRNLFKGREIKGRVCGLYGCGRVAKILSRYLQAMGAQVIAYDPYVKDDAMIELGIVPVQRNELFKQSDTCFVLCPLNEETTHSITYSDLQTMKKGAQLINTARGKIIVEEDLVRALTEGILGNVAVDVLAGERESEGWETQSPLLGYAQTHANCIITPHIAGATYDSMESTEIFIAKKIKQYLAYE